MKKPKKASPHSGTAERGLIRWLLTLYRPLVRFFIAHRYLAAARAIILILIGVIIYPQLGSEFTPTLQEGTLVLRLTMARSIALTESTRITQIVERRLMKTDK